MLLFGILSNNNSRFSTSTGVRHSEFRCTKTTLRITPLHITAIRRICKMPTCRATISICCWLYILIIMVNGEDEENLTTATTELSPFIKSEVVPDVLDKPPQSLLHVKFRLATMKLGEELTPTHAMDEPEIIWNADPVQFYTILMTHPDAPTRKRPVFRELRQWLVVNIPGANISSGEIISSYIKPEPAEGTGLHRYIILLFVQPEKLSFANESISLSPQDLSGRIKFSTREFITKYNLTEPNAGTFFEAEWDESVPRLYEHLAWVRTSGIDFSIYQ